MEKVLKLYTYIDGVNDTPFPSEDEQVIIADFRCDYKRMGAAPTITCSIQHYLCLDNLWSYHVYAQFNGERFFIKQIPSSSFDNTDARYKHELELVSERIILDNVYFYDVVSEDYEEDKPVSNSSNVVFFGDIHEFAQRLNHSLNYSKLNYSVVVDDGISSEAKLLSFQDQFFSNVLQEIYNVYEIPYYIVGNVIHIGYTDNTINHVFKYGVDESLLSIQKQNANKKIINRITGIGSSDNVPYYYPNFDNKGVTEVLYNGETGKVNIVDENKYNKIKLNDVLSYNMYKVDDKSLLDNSFFTDINFTYTDNESQYGIEFYYKFTIKETCNIRLSLKTTYQDSEDIFCDLYDENKNYIGYFKDGDVVTNLPEGNYRIKVAWNLFVAEPMTRPLAEQLVIEHVSVNAIIIGETTYWWSLNGKNIKLSDYGISLSFAPSVGDEISVSQLSYIKPSAHLMPSIYRETIAKERFYNAINKSYTKPNSDEYYTFNNPYIVGKPKEYIYNLEDIKPTIKGITNAEDFRIDMFSEFAFDENDNDEFDTEGNYLHPYFFGKLRKFDGEFGFNLFDHAIDEDEMVISMTSGACGACEFIIGVDDETQKNLVQVDENGNLLRDSNGNVRCGREGMPKETPQEKQNDTKNNEVWVALKKDQNTFGVLMPNAQSNYRPQAGDTFVILHIDLPKAYILAAEKKLEQELIKYMSENNDEKFTFSLSFSRIFFAENPIILEQLNENSRIQIEYDGRQYLLYVSSYSYNITNEQPLPEIRIELSDVLTIAQNSLNNTISELKTDFLSNINLTESQILLYTSNVKKDLNSKVDNTKEEIHQTISNVETAMKQYTNDAKAVLHESIKSIDEIKINTKDVYTKQDIDDNFVTKTTKQEVSGEKNFIGGLKINNQEIIYDVEKNYWKFQGNLVITGGIAMYAQDESINIPTIAEGLPFDQRTIWFNPTTGQIEVIGGTGGGSGEGVSNFWELSGIPSWITNTKPTYSYSEIQGTPDLSKYALVSQIPSLEGYAKLTDIPLLSGYATQAWVNQQGFLTQHQDLSGYQPLITSSNKLAYSLISGTPTLAAVATSGKYSDLSGLPTIPTSLKNPYALSFGSKSYDGSEKITLSASDLGALTSHQTIHALTIKNSAGTTQLTYTPNSATGSLTLTKAMVGLGNVDNTALSTWAGTNKITTLGTITTGTWNGTKITNDYLANNKVSISGVDVSLGGGITQSALRTALGLGSNAYSSTAYLPLTGGTLSDYTETPLILKGTYSDNVLLHLHNKDNIATSIGKYGTYTFLANYANGNGTGELEIHDDGRLTYATGGNNYSIWHEGNDGSGSRLDADLLDGKHYSDIVNGNVATATRIQAYTYNGSEKIIVSGTRTDSTYNRLIYDNGYTYRLKDDARGVDADIATVADNVASATKLQTTRYIWGRSFDGTGNITGDLEMGNNIILKQRDTGGNSLHTIYTSTSNNLVIGNGHAVKGYNTYLDGNTLFFRHGAAPSIGMVLNSSGNVTIGSSDLALTNAKLYVDGKILIPNNIALCVKATDGTDMSVLQNTANNNLSIGLDTSAKGYSTYISGNNIYLRYGTSRTTGIELTSAGRVSIKGNVDIPNNKSIYLKDSIGTDIQMLIAQTNNDFVLGGGTCSKKYWTLIKGYKIAFYTAESGTRAMLINDSGNITIGQGDLATSNYKLYIDGIVRATNYIYSDSLLWFKKGSEGIYIGHNAICWHNSGAAWVSNLIGFESNKVTINQSTTVQGDFLSTGGITMYSARKLKNIVDERGLSLEELSVIKPTRFTWKDGRDSKIHIGGIADDVMKVLPEVIYKTDNDTLTMDYGNAAFAIAASLIKPVVNHEERIKMLEEENKILKEEIEQLKWNIA